MKGQKKKTYYVAEIGSDVVARFEYLEKAFAAPVHEGCSLPPDA